MIAHEKGLTEWKARSLLELSEYKEKPSDATDKTSDDSAEDSNASHSTAQSESGEDEDDETDQTANDNAKPSTDRSGGRGKPEWLMRALVRDYSMQGDMVCDPLAGWGSTLRAAQRLRLVQLLLEIKSLNRDEYERLMGEVRRSAKKARG